MRDGEFRCSRCGHPQRVLPEAGDGELGDLRLKDYWIGKYDELTPFAKELGRDVQTGGLDVIADGIECKVGLSVNSGTVVGLDHQALAVGLPSMRLLTEMPEHVEAKARELAKEVQTGDQAFDDEVYIESPASDADVQTVLSSPAVRHAIRMLLRDTSTIVIDERNGVSFSMSRDASPFETTGIRKRLAWLRVVAGAPRPLVAEMLPVPARARVPKRIMGWTYPIVILLTIVGLAKWTPLRGELVFQCILAGFVLAVIMVPIWPRLLRGRSTSHSETRAWRIATFIYAPLLVVGASTTYNGAFDDSKERDVTMKIVSVDKSSDEGVDTWHAKTVDDEGDSHSYAFKHEPKPGQLVKVGWKDGALGWRWESRDAIVVEAAKP